MNRSGFFKKTLTVAAAVPVFNLQSDLETKQQKLNIFPGKHPRSYAHFIQEWDNNNVVIITPELQFESERFMRYHKKTYLDKIKLGCDPTIYSGWGVFHNNNKDAIDFSYKFKDWCDKNFKEQGLNDIKIYIGPYLV
jgi:hypothetical protein